jgi:hypothetical protein
VFVFHLMRKCSMFAIILCRLACPALSESVGGIVALRWPALPRKPLQNRLSPPDPANVALRRLTARKSPGNGVMTNCVIEYNRMI